MIVSVKSVSAVVAATMMVVGSASAAFSITQGSSAPTYGTVLDFENVSTGFYAANAWSNLGLASFTDGASGGLSVVDVSGTSPWVTSNVADGFAFGLYLTFADDATEASFQLWSSAGPPGPFGGLSVVLLDGNGNSIDGLTVSTPVWVNNPNNGWINITTSGSSTFRGIAISYGGFGFPALYADNFSWNLVPTPGALALLGLGFMGSRRRLA
ncbi:MAG: hypothetical protein KF724_01280 [Phycisphaeraceae bacterium]|nr:hypothetical protein [Phycisphaeraceae bacterium]